MLLKVSYSLILRPDQNLATLSSLSPQVRKWVEGWHPTEPKTRELYQLMWEAFSDSGNTSYVVGYHFAIVILKPCLLVV